MMNHFKEFIAVLFRKKGRKVEEEGQEEVWAKNLFSDLGRLGGRLIVQKTR